MFYANSNSESDIKMIQPPEARNRHKTIIFCTYIELNCFHGICMSIFSTFILFNYPERQEGQIKNRSQRVTLGSDLPKVSQQVQSQAIPLWLPRAESTAALGLVFSRVPNYSLFQVSFYGRSGRDGLLSASFPKRFTI